MDTFLCQDKGDKIWGNAEDTEGGWQFRVPIPSVGGDTGNSGMDPSSLGLCWSGGAAAGEAVKVWSCRF